MSTLLQLLLDPITLTACAMGTTRAAWQFLASGCTASRLRDWRAGGTPFVALLSLLASAFSGG